VREGQPLHQRSTPWLIAIAYGIVGSPRPWPTALAGPAQRVPRQQMNVAADGMHHAKARRVGHRGAKLVQMEEGTVRCSHRYCRQPGLWRRSRKQHGFHALGASLAPFPSAGGICPCLCVHQSPPHSTTETSLRNEPRRWSPLAAVTRPHLRCR